MKKGLIVAVVALVLAAAVYMVMFSSGVKIASDMLKKELDSDPRYSYSEYKYENKKIIINDLSFIDDKYKIFVKEAKIEKITKALNADIKSTDVEIFKIVDEFNTPNYFKSVVMKSTDMKKLIRYNYRSSKPSEAGISSVAAIAIMDDELEMPINALLKGKRLAISIKGVNHSTTKLELAELVIRDIDLLHEIAKEVRVAEDFSYSEGERPKIFENYATAFKKLPLESFTIKNLKFAERDNLISIDSFELESLDSENIVVRLELKNFIKGSSQNDTMISYLKFDELNIGDYIDYFAKTRTELFVTKNSGDSSYMNMLIESSFLTPVSYKGFKNDGVKINVKNYDYDSEKSSVVFSADINLDTLNDAKRGEFIENADHGATLTITLSEKTYNELLDNSIKNIKDMNMLRSIVGDKNNPIKINIGYKRESNENKTLINDKLDFNIDGLFTYNIQTTIKGVDKDDVLEGNYNFVENMQMPHLALNYEDKGMFEKTKEYISDDEPIYLAILLSSILDDANVGKVLQALKTFKANQKIISLTVNSDNVSIGDQFSSLTNFATNSAITIHVNDEDEIKVVFDQEKIEALTNRSAYYDNYDYYDDEYYDDEYYDDEYYDDEEYYDEDEEYLDLD